MREKGLNSCNDRVSILKNEVVPKNLEQFDLIDDSNLENIINSGRCYMYADYIDEDGKHKFYKINAGQLKNIQALHADWKAEKPPVQLGLGDDPQPYSGYIENKPGVDNLDADKVALYSIGEIKAGDTLKEGTSIGEIINKMLGLNPTGHFSVYKATDFPGNFDIDKIRHLDDPVCGESAHINFSDEIKSKGFEWEDFTLENQYFLFIINAATGIRIKSIEQAGFKIGYNEKIVEDDNEKYYIYYYDKTSTGKFTLRINFKGAQ